MKRIFRSTFHRLLFIFSLLLLFLSFLFSPSLRAQTPSVNILPALAPLDRNSPIEMIAATLDADLSENAGHIRVGGTNTYKLHNTDTLNDVEIPLGFPTWSGGNLTSDPTRFDDFKVYVDDRAVRLARANAPLRLGNEVRTVEWYSWTLKFANDEKHLVRVEFTQDLGDQSFPRFQFGILTSTGWKGRIGSERLALRMPAPTTLEQFLSFEPFSPDFDGQTLTWNALAFEPSTNLGVTLIRPSDWDALNGKRQAVAQNPNDVNAHLALGTAYQELATIASIRRDSFLSLALAEFEIAARLDSKNVTARAQLAQLAETRAGAPNGTRNTNYVALAIQHWQALLGTPLDAEAKKHLAEDNFYLGLDARTRQDYQTAVSFFDAARSFAPNGAPPTFTLDRVNTETRATLIAWARALAAQGNFADALTRARQAHRGEYVPPAAPTLPTFAVTRAQISTNAVERLILFHIIGLPENADETKHALDTLIAALARTNVATVSVETNGNERIVTMRIPYTSDAELYAKQRALADALGPDEAWLVARALLVPPILEIERTQDAVTEAVRYREVFDFSAAARARQMRFDALRQALVDLDKAKADDEAAQLDRVLTRQTQTWLTNAAAGGAAKIEFVTIDGARQEWTLTFGDTRELRLERTSIRPELYFVTGAILIAVLITTVGVWWLLRKPSAVEEANE